MELKARGLSIPLDRVAMMGVLNVTPDSFSDGGLWLDPGAAAKHGIEMAEHGAAIIDVGGESTRPGAEPVPEDEELHRIIPVIQGLAADGHVVSVDTRKPTVAEAAVEAGAVIVNDTSGEAFDPAMGDVAARTGAAVVIMHSRGTPATMRSLTDYSDVVNDVVGFLRERARSLEQSGIGRDRIALDPGIGFAKTPRQSLEVLNRLDELVATGYPVLVGTSRKSFIGAVLDLPEDRRIEGTAASVAIAVWKGAHIVRVHDVEEMTRIVRMTEAVLHPEEW
jgi:dihydropteroate synthase